MWAFDERAEDVVHVDAADAIRVVHVPPHDAQDGAGGAAAVVANDGGLVIVRDGSQTIYHVALDGTIAPAQLRPGYNARNFGVDSAGSIFFTLPDANAPLERFRNGTLDNVDIARSSEPETGLEIVDDAFEQGRFDGPADATYRFGLRGTHESAAVSGAVHDGAGGVWASDCNAHAVAHVKADGSRLSFPLAADFCPTDLSAGPSGVWLLDRSRPGFVLVSPTGLQTQYALPTKSASVREDSMRVAPDGTLWFIERNPNRIAYVSGSHVVELPTFDTRGPQATVLR